MNHPVLLNPPSAWTLYLNDPFILLVGFSPSYRSAVAVCHAAAGVRPAVAAAHGPVHGRADAAPLGRRFGRRFWRRVGQGDAGVGHGQGADDCGGENHFDHPSKFDLLSLSTLSNPLVDCTCTGHWLRVEFAFD